MSKVHVSYKSPILVRSLIQLAREVKKALGINEQTAEFEYDCEEKRKIFREEVSHHSPLTHRPVRVVGLLSEGDDGEYNQSAIAIKHYGASPSEELESALAPTHDRRFHHDQSDQDLRIAKESRRRLGER